MKLAQHFAQTKEKKDVNVQIIWLAWIKCSAYRMIDRPIVRIFYSLVSSLFSFVIGVHEVALLVPVLFNSFFLRFVSIFFCSIVSLALLQASFESHNYVSYLNSVSYISYNELNHT